MFKTKIKIGIIGFGSFGQLIAKELKRDFYVYVWNRGNREKEAKEIGIGYVSIEEAASKEIVILATAVYCLEEILHKIKPCLRKNSLVLDVCSVKEYPVKLMEKILPKNIDILGTHPLFGPESIKYKENRKIVICPVRIKKEGLIKVISYLKRKGYKVIITTPEKHDSEIAKTQALAHFIGRVLEKMDLKEQEIDVMNYRKLLEIMNVVKNDSWQLFLDIERKNRYAEKVRKEFVESAVKLSKELK